MMSDLVIDFDYSLKLGAVYLVEVDIPPDDHINKEQHPITMDVYVVANNYHQAQYIVQSMYPNSLSCCVHETPITEYEYAARRNRSVLR